MTNKKKRRSVEAGGAKALYSNSYNGPKPTTPPGAGQGLLNRHQRRQALRRLQREAAGVFTTELIMAHDLRDHRLQYTVMDWVLGIPRCKPLCLGCSHEWSTLDEAPPAAFLIILPFAVERPSALMVSAVCAGCVGRADLPDIIDDGLRKFWPDWRRIERPHAAPGGIQ